MDNSKQNELYQNDNGEWALCRYKIKYTQNGEQVEQLTDDKTWFETFATMHSNFKIDEVTELTYTDEQKARLTEIQRISPKYYDELYDYVMNGKIKTDSGIFAEKNLEGTVTKIGQQITSLMLGV